MLSHRVKMECLKFGPLSLLYWALIFNEFECFFQLLASLVAQWVKSLPKVQETWVSSLGWEDQLKKEMATHSSILAWEIPWTEKPGGLQSMGSQESDITEQLKFWPLSLLYIRTSFWVNLSSFSCYFY